MARRGENIRKRKDGRWEGRYIKGYDLNTKRARYSSIYGKSYTEVKGKLNEAKYLTNNGREYVDHGNKRFGCLLAEWLERQKAHLKPSSLAKYCNLIKNHIIPQLGHVPLRDLNVSLFEDFLYEKAGSDNHHHNGLSNSTLLSLQYIINAVISYAASQNLVKPFTLRIQTGKGCVRSIAVLSKNEEARLEAYLSQHICAKNLGIMLSLYCGLRIGEVCALKWQDIDLNNNLLSVERTVQRLQNIDSDRHCKTVLQVGPPKSASSIRRIQLPKFIIPVIHEVAAMSTPQGYIVSQSSDKPMEPRSYQYYLKRLLEQLGIRNINFHILRHTFATNCVALGFDTKSLSEILGHSNVNITMNKYVHPSDDHKQRQMDFWTPIKGQIYGQQDFCIV